MVFAILSNRLEVGSTMKKKKTPAQIFLNSFLRSMAFIGILILVGFGSYKVTMFYYSIDGPPDNEKTKELIKDIVSDAKVEPISKNLIISQRDDTGVIEQLILEITNTYTNNLDYVTMPVDTELTLNNELYQRLFTINSEIPQIIRLSELSSYYEGDYIYEYCELILEDIYDIDISYYTVLGSDYFNTIYEDKNGKLVYTDQWKNRLSDSMPEEDIKSIIEELYQKGHSNLSIRNKEKYIPTYMEINPEYIYFYQCVQGGIDMGKIMLQQIMDNDITHTSIQKQDTNIPGQIQISSKGYNIRILNGSGITGLAARYKDKLVEDGYTITNIGNYNETTLYHTIIMVNTEGLGFDLSEYFAEPEVKVEDLEEGIDIQIILGKADNINN